MSKLENEEVKNLLIIRFSSIGDILLTSSLVRQAKHKYPQARLSFALDKRFAELYENNPRVDKIELYDKSVKIDKVVDLKNEIKKSLPDGKYDCVIDLQRNLRSKIFRSGLSDLYLLVSKRRLHKLSLVYLKRPLIKNPLPVPLLNLLAANRLGIEDDGLGLEFWLPEEKNSGAYPPFHGKKTIGDKLKIAIAPNAYHKTKRWGTEKFAELADTLTERFDADITLIGGVKDKSITDEVKGLSDNIAEDVSESNSLIKTARAIDRCHLIVTNDTAAAHIAAARKVPVVEILGSTVKEFGFYPFRVENEIVERELSCRPCTHIGKSECPKGHFGCMKLIESEQVFNVCEKLLKRVY